MCRNTHCTTCFILQIQALINTLYLDVWICRSELPPDISATISALSTTITAPTSHHATETLWRILQCIRSLQSCPAHQPHEVGATYFNFLLTNFIQQLHHSAAKNSTRESNRQPFKDLVSLAFPGMLHRSLWLLSAAHHIEHLACAQAKSIPSALYDVSNGQKHRHSAAPLPDVPLWRQAVEQEPKWRQLRTNVSLLLLQLQGPWNFSTSGSVSHHASPADIYPNCGDPALLLPLWNAVSSAILHFYTASLLPVKTTLSTGHGNGPAANLSKPKSANTMSEFRILDLGTSLIGSLAQSAASQCLCWLHDTYAMLSIGKSTSSRTPFCNLQDQLSPPPAGAFQVALLCVLFASV